MIRNLINGVRFRIAKRFYYWGYRIAPEPFRGWISQINAFGLAWIEHDFPDHFEIDIRKKEEPHV